jgi:hypothetical protein
MVESNALLVGVALVSLPHKPLAAGGMEDEVPVPSSARFVNLNEISQAKVRTNAFMGVRSHSPEHLSLQDKTSYRHSQVCRHCWAARPVGDWRAHASGFRRVAGGEPPPQPDC